MSSASLLGPTTLDAVMAHATMRDVATAIAAEIYAVPTARLECGRPSPQHWPHGVGDAWDLAAWLLWRWTPLPLWLVVDVEGRRIVDLLEGAIRVKAALNDPAVTKFVAGAERAMHQALRRPPRRCMELLLPHSATCRAWTAESGRPPFFSPQLTTGGLQ